MVGHTEGGVSGWSQADNYPKRALKELAVILLLLGWARVGSRVELPVCGGAFRLSAAPVQHNGGRRFLGNYTSVGVHF